MAKRAMTGSRDRGDAGAEARDWYAENWDPTVDLGTWWKRLADSGWAFPSWPVGLGGRGLHPRDAARAVQARREAGAYGPPNGVGTFLVVPTLLHYATDAQRQRYIPAIVDGTANWCQLFSEPGYGSDMAGLATRATLDGEEWIVNGQKVWNSGAHYADYGILIARTDPDLPKHKGITFFLIDMRQEGVEVRPLREMTGDAAFNEVFLRDARVHDRDRVSARGDGWRVAMTTLSHERDPDNPGLGDTAAFYQADLSVPVGEHAKREAAVVDGFSLSLSGQAGTVFDRLIADTDAADDPRFRQELMALHGLRRVTRWSGERGAAMANRGGQPGPEISTLKLSGAEISRRMRDLGLRAMGPDAMLWADDAPGDGLFHRYAMFTPASSIAGGSDEVQRNIIGERVLGLPREPGESEQRELPWSALRRG